MQGGNVRKFRRRGGFTFAEVLVTLAILGALLAVAIPATVAMARSLKMMELDACARQIAVAVQNNITGMKSAGTLKSFGDKNTGSIGGYCISNGHAEVQKILPLGAIDPAVAGKYYTIVYNSDTGTVLEVYYAEHSFTVSDDLSGMGTTKVEARKTAKIGYYNGADIEAGPVGTLPQPIVTVTNGENLVVEVTTTPMNWQSTAKLTLHVAQENGTGEVKFEMPSLQVATKILDSLTDSTNRFKTLFGKVIAPGENLKIWATLDPIEPEKYLSATSNTEYTNSLFGTYNTTENAVTIANPRHLQNLDKNHSNFKITNNITALQTADITWQAVQSFVPINNSQLTSYNGGTKLISGLKVTANTSAGLFGGLSGQTLTGIRLVNPSVSAGGQNAGALVGTAENVKITDCFAYAEKVNGKWPIAQISGGTAGGLIGSAIGCNISYSGVAMPTVTGTTVAAGGLIGEATSTVVTNSYADTDKLGANNFVAGFIGNATGKNVKVENCYAVGTCYAAKNVVPDEYKPSGFISGEKRRNDVAVNVKDSYCAMTYLDAEGNPLRLKNIAGFSRLYGTYANCAYLTPVGVTVSTELPDSEVPDISYAELAARTTENAIWTKYPMSHPYRDDLQGKAYPFPALKQVDGIAKMPHYGNWPAAPVPVPKGEVFLAYYEEYTDGTTGVYYLDKDGKVINTLAGNDKTIRSTGYGLALPKDSTINVTDITLKIPVEGEEKTIDNKMDDPKVEPIPIDNVNFYLFGEDMLEDFDEESMDAMKESQTFSAKIIIGVKGAAKEDDKTYQINPNFAAGIAPADTALGTKDWPLQVRTQKQLQAVNSVTVTDERCYFLQTHNIPIVNAKGWYSIDFREIYDGNQQKISGLPKPLFATVQSGSTVQNVVIEQANVAAAQGDGIFAKVNSGTITSCNVRNSKIESNGGRDKFVAGFVGTNNGTIQNSHVHPDQDKKPSTISSKNGDAYGFVGTNSGTITLCSAVANVTSTKGNAAGFVGTNNGTIQTSYANCMVQGGTGASGFVNVNTNEKQFAIKNCYAMGSATATGGTAVGFAIQSKQMLGISKCYAAVVVRGSQSNSFGTRDVNDQWTHTCYYYAPNGTSASDAKSINDDSGAIRLTSYADAIGSNLLGNLTGWRPSGIWANNLIAHPFNPALGETIPFPTIIGNEHYGDWPTRPLSDGNFMGVFYYEKQPDGTYFIDAAGIEVEFKDESFGTISKVKGDPFAHIVKGDFRIKNSHLPKGLGVFWTNNIGQWGPQSAYEYDVYGGEQSEHKQCVTPDRNKTFNIDDNYTFVAHLLSNGDNNWHWGEKPIIAFRNNRSGLQWEYNFQYDTTINTWTITKIK